MPPGLRTPAEIHAATRILIAELGPDDADVETSSRPVGGRELRGVPVVGYGGAIPGTQPEDALLEAEEHAERQRRFR